MHLFLKCSSSNPVSLAGEEMRLWKAVELNETQSYFSMIHFQRPNSKRQL